MESVYYSDHMVCAWHKIKHVIDAENTRQDSGERCFDLNCVVPIIVSRNVGCSNV